MRNIVVIADHTQICDDTVDFYIANAREIDENDHVEEVENWDYVQVELTKKAALIDKRRRDRGDKFRGW